MSCAVGDSNEAGRAQRSEHVRAWFNTPGHDSLDTTVAYNVYRERVGNSGYRVVYEISDGAMTVVAVLPKSDDTYDLAALARRSSE